MKKRRGGGRPSPPPAQVAAPAPPSPSPSPPRPSRVVDLGLQIPAFFWIGIPLLVLFAYIPALRAGYVWDDDLYVTNNFTLRQDGGLLRIWSDPRASPSPYPLVFTSLWMEHKLWGLDPFGYHAVNIALHAINALMLAALLRRLRIPGALAAAAIFAVHPVKAESVAWITERKDMLSGLFYLASFWFWLDFSERRRRAAYALSLAAFALAMLSKTVVCTLPVILLLWEWRRNRAPLRPLLFRLAPMFALALALGLLTIWWERVRTGATGDAVKLSPIDRLQIAARVPWFYLFKTAWPSTLTAIYPQWSFGSALSWAFVAASAGAGAGWIALRKRLPATEQSLAIFFLLTIAPAMGFINYSTMVYSYAADHYQYLAGIGWIALACSLGARVVERRGAPIRRFIPAALAALVLLFAALAWRESSHYKDLPTLFEANLRANPRSWGAHLNIGFARYTAGNFEEAERHYRAALAINPASSRGESNLGVLCQDTRRAHEAKLHYAKARELDAANPDPVNNLGRLALEAGQVDEAIALFNETLRIDPSYALALNNLGAAYMAKGEAAPALESLKRAIALRPDYAEARNSLGVLLLGLHRPQEAAEQFRLAIEAKGGKYPDAEANLQRLASELRAPQGL